MLGPKTETKLAPAQTDSRIRAEPSLPTRSAGFHVGPSTKKAWDRGGFRGGFRGGSRSGTGGGRGGAAVGKLRAGSFGESGEDWWGLLTAVSREVGFTLTRIEERCER